MRIQDLKTVYICPDHTEKYHTRKVHMDTMLTELGFKDFTHYKSGTEAYPTCLTNAVIDILTQYSDTPVLILEDDIEWTGIKEFDFVPDADAIYLGNSRSGGHPTEPRHYGECKFMPYSATQVRITNMLSGHAILFISAAFKTSVINLLTNSQTPHDILLSRLHSHFKVIANKKPVFYQAAKFNDDMGHVERWTDVELVRPMLHLIATNKYISFLPEMTTTVYTHFFPKTLRHVVVYTNMPNPENHVRYGDPAPTIVFHYVHIEHEAWPMITLKRFHTFSGCSIDADYSFYCDVDAYFAKTLTTDLLKDTLYGTIHPGYTGTKGTVCSNPASTACIPVGENTAYFCGGFFGGSHAMFMNMSTELRSRIQTDIDNRVMADWHDESHLNWYFWKNPPAVFAYPFAITEPYTPTSDTYIVFIEKNLRGGSAMFREPPPTPKLQRFVLTSSGLRVVNISR